MKLKAPQGVGDPCVAGTVIVARDGLYEVEAEIGALLVECFGFVKTEAREAVKVAPSASGAPRRRVPAKKSPT
jgi:hypothetical protein